MSTAHTTPPKSLAPFAWLSIAAAIITIALKTWAWWATGSVGLLSDALESVVNLVAAIVALIALTVAAREPDEEHAYGHGKAEYFSSGVEGGLVFIAAIGIFYTAIPRLFNPEPLEGVGLGLVMATIASAINGAVGWRLMRAAKEYRSITLESDAKHLFTDVWTSVAVIGGVFLVTITGWGRLDAILAIGVGINILLTGYELINRSVHGLLDTAIPDDEMEKVTAVLERFQHEQGVLTHAIRTRQAGRRRFISMHVLVPGSWTVSRGHDLVAEIEADIRAALPESTVFTHLEPIEEPESWNDAGLDG